MHQLRRDLHFPARKSTRQPGFILIAGLTLTRTVARFAALRVLK